MGDLDVCRQGDNTCDTPFHLKFVERLYDGSPRWWKDGEYDWKSIHVERVANDERLDRESDVTALIGLAHNYNQFYRETTGSTLQYLETCVKPDCKLRNWRTLSWKGNFYSVHEDGISQGVHKGKDRVEAVAAFQRGLKHMSEGDWNKLESSCQCGEKSPVFAVTAITNKWIYVLKESGSKLTPHLAIEARGPSTGGATSQNPSVGKIYPYQEGKGFKGNSQLFDGDLQLHNIESATWHFFLSPVELGPKALELLCRAPEEDPKFAQRRLKAANWKVGVMAGLQPWSATVKRKFLPGQLKTHYEFVPLVDAFAWVAEIAEFDYNPILAAQQLLIQHPAEQSKAFICSTLAQMIGRERVKDSNPPRFVEDKWNIAGVTESPPPGYLDSENIAEAWITRYRGTLGYLTLQTNDACARLWFPMRFSLAHRIVEQACQEQDGNPEFLGFGLTHWAHILRQMLACHAGAVFTAWLAGSTEASERIPQKNVLQAKPESLDKTLGPALLVHIFMYLSAAVVAKSSRPPAPLLREHLKNIGVEASTPLDYFLSFKNLGLDIAGKWLENYEASMPKDVDFEHIHGAISPAWQGRLKNSIELFSNMKDVEEGLSLLIEFYEYGRKVERTDTEWERNAYQDKASLAQRIKEKIEFPAKAATFICELTHKALKGNVALRSETGKLVIEKLESEGRKGLTGLAPEALGVSAEELDEVLASRSLKVFKTISGIKRVLAGPVALFIGICELASQHAEAIRAMEAGDDGAFLGQTFQAASTALMVVVAGLEVAALFGLASAAGVAAFAGPVGWLAAGMMLIGSLIIAWFSENDWQLYAQNCFLGELYNGPGRDMKAGKPWMGAWSWSQLHFEKGSSQDSPQKWERQRLALLRLLTGFSTWISNSYLPNKIMIYPGYVPNGCYFEVEVDLSPQDADKPTEGYTLLLWAERKEYHFMERKDRKRLGWNWEKPKDWTIEFNKDGSILVGVYPHDIHGRPQRDYRIRLMLDPAGRNQQPVTAKWLKQTTREDEIYNYVSTSDADKATVEAAEAAEAAEMAHKLFGGADDGSKEPGLETVNAE